jgi:phosphate transport system substrate-binding protein
VAVVLLLLLSVSLSGCIGDGEGRSRLNQTGSSTVLPLAIAWAEEYDGADIFVSGGGSSHGLNALLNGETDLCDASRLLKGKDYEQVGGDPAWVNDDGTANRPVNGVLPIKWVVAFDVLAVVVNERNDWARSLNFSQLYSIFVDDDPAIYWDKVPGLEGAPHSKIEIYAPDEASGTYDYFYESLIPGWGKDDQLASTRLDGGDGVYHPTSDDNVIVTAIKDRKNAIGFLGFAYFLENKDVLTPVAIAMEGGEHLPPDFDNVSSYPLARPLFIYTDGEPVVGSPVNSYLSFVLGIEGQGLVPEIGYVSVGMVDPDLLENQREILRDATEGSG